MSLKGPVFSRQAEPADKGFKVFKNCVSRKLMREHMFSRLAYYGKVNRQRLCFAVIKYKYKII
ncbi:MAG: hypothetical protein QMC67_06595 [Candidatus Wallbacteria bacterium]